MIKKTVIYFIILFIITGAMKYSLLESVSAQVPDAWWDDNWLSCRAVNITETYGETRINELVDVFIRFSPGTCSDPKREIRVVYHNGTDWIEVPSQVYNVTREENYVSSCNVVFLANCSAYGTVTYYIYYNNPYADVPVYDGLRVYEEAAGDTYNITAVKDGVEKNYARIFWKNSLNLYSNGSLVTWPGGPAGWEFSQINIASLWADAWDTPWFGAGKKLSLINEGPLFVELNYTEAYASDLWGGIYDHNVTTTMILRVYFKFDLNPLIYFEKSFKIVTDLANYTIKNPLYLDFKLADNSSRAIYRNFTWKDIGGSLSVVETEIPVVANIWSPENPLGWWSYNGSRTDTNDKPAANMGFIPITAEGTIQGRYTLQTSQKIEDDDHHCSQWINGNYNGKNGDVIKVSGYIITTVPVNCDVSPVMDKKAERLRNPMPLEVSVGKQMTLQLIDRDPPSIREVIPALFGQEVFEGHEIEIKTVVVDEISVIAQSIIQPSGVLNVSIHYSTDGGNTWRIIEMAESGKEHEYVATLPAFESGTKVLYKIVAFDKLLNKAESSIYSYKIVIHPKTGLWFILGFAVGVVVSLIIAGATYYARKR